MTLTIAGTAIIALAWLLKLLQADKHPKSSEEIFILTYGIGTAVLVADVAAVGGMGILSWTHAITLLVVALIYLKRHHH